MNEGDTVCYTLGHYLWLRDSGNWISKYVPRRALKGTVTAVNAKVIEVRWATNGIIVTRHHFPENLQVVKSE